MNPEQDTVSQQIINDLIRINKIASNPSFEGILGKIKILPEDYKIEAMEEIHEAAENLEELIDKLNEQ